MQQNIMLSVGLSNVVFEGLYSARFISVHYLLQAAQKKERNLDISHLAIKGATGPLK